MKQASLSMKRNEANKPVYEEQMKQASKQVSNTTWYISVTPL
jgi:hypothetical protein